MSAKIVVPIISFCVFITGVVSGNLVQAMMIGEINRKSADEHRESYFGFTPWKSLRIVSEYRTLYPKGKLYTYHVAAIGLMIIGFLGVGSYIWGF